MGRFFASLRLPLRVTRQQVVYLKPEAGAARDFEADRLPVWIDADANIYGFPADGRIEGVKLASHHLGEDDRPGRRRAARRTTAYQAQMADYASARFAGLTRQVTHAQTCLYTNTPERRFSVDTVPGHAARLAGQRLLRAWVQVHRPARQDRRRGRDAGRCAAVLVPLRAEAFRVELRPGR